ncbi:MAG: hypothetical protein V1844_14315 [Pseudomonadota bacterium]
MKIKHWKRNFIRIGLLSLLALAWVGLCLELPAGFVAAADDPGPPASPVKLIFIHHSTGGNWLADPYGDEPYGGLGSALMNNNYFVSATNYGWGPDSIGDRTDIVNWPEWFNGPDRDAIMAAVYSETGRNFQDFGSWSRLAVDPGGQNEIVLFKSCFPNSNLYGNPLDPPLAEPNDWEYSVANAKAVYNRLLTYFAGRRDKLFIVVTAPPLSISDYPDDPDLSAAARAANARAFNNWLVRDWLSGYAHKNVAVFDYYNVLTSNGGDVNTNDAGQSSGNHHRWWNGAIQHVQGLSSNFAAYPSGDSHPSAAGHQKATSEFISLLNIYYHRWKSVQVGANPGRVQTSLAADQVVELLINSTNSHGDTPVYQWLLLTATFSGNAIPLYLLSDKGIIEVNQALQNLVEYTFSFAAGGVTAIARLSMRDLGLKTGDALVYGYAYQKQTGGVVLDSIVLDNIVMINVK